MKRPTYLILMFLTVACDLVVDIDVPFEKKQIVINCVFNPDSVWSAKISLNKHILDTLEHLRLSDANVVVYDDGNNPIETLRHVTGGIYRSNVGKPSVGKSYSIRVDAPKYESVTSESYTPAAASIQNVSVTERDPETPGGYETKIKVKFQDNGSQTNFYQIKAYQVRESLLENFRIVQYSNVVDINMDDPSENENFGNWSEGVYLRDILFNGKEKEVHLKTNYPIGNDFTIELRTLSQDYYNYHVTRALQQSINDDPLAQPLNVYSNVKNGFGIFAGYSASTFITNRRDRPITISASSLKVSRGDVVRLTVDNLGEIRSNEYLMVIMKSNRNPQYPNAYGYQYAHRVSANTIEFKVSEYEVSGKVAVNLNGLIGVSDFDIEILD